MNPNVIKIIPRRDFTLSLVFENGEERIFDVSPLLDKPAFRPLKNFGRFKLVKPILGGIEWQSGQDLSKDTLYLRSMPIAE